MRKFHLRNFGLRVLRASAIENRFGRCRIVHGKTYRALAILEREGLKRQNVDASIGERLTELSKRSRAVFQSDGELLRGGHNRTSLRCASGEGLGGSCEMQRCPESYSCATRAARPRVPCRVPKKKVFPDDVLKRFSHSRLELGYRDVRCANSRSISPVVRAPCLALVGRPRPPSRAHLCPGRSHEPQGLRTSTFS